MPGLMFARMNAQKALQESLDLFDEEFKNSFENRYPLYEDEL
jgi:hypothetical protein